MRKSIKVSLSSYGRESVELTFDVEPTVDQALAEAGWQLATGETPSVNGVKADLEDVLENGDTLIITGKKDGGSSNAIVTTNSSSIA